MKLIALVLALGLERVVTHLLHLRELRWFDRYFDWGLARMRNRPPWQRWLIGLGVLLLPILPVVIIAVSLLTADIFWDVPYFLFAVLVLLFSLGPRDLGAEVRDYCETVELGKVEESQRIAKELLETDAPRDHGRRQLAVEEAVLVQANNRIFGVVFFFVVFGPIGAWLFRISDLFRRRAVYEAQRNNAPERAQPYDQVELQHGVLAWVPARLTCLGYALAGSFEDALSAWRHYGEQAASRFFDINDELVAAVGRAALARPVDELVDIDCVNAAMRLMKRTLFIWVTVIALMTLFGWAV
jgi:membrane protein required for beta-lactamase induction